MLHNKSLCNLENVLLLFYSELFNYFFHFLWKFCVSFYGSWNKLGGVRKLKKDNRVGERLFGAPE